LKIVLAAGEATVAKEKNGNIQVNVKRKGLK
jgi:hypothetical protein